MKLISKILTIIKRICLMPYALCPRKRICLMPYALCPRKRICLMPYALCLVVLCATSAHANDFFAPRFVSSVPTATECVGQTNDILCVFDTVIACAIRRDPALCAAVGLEFDDVFHNAFWPMRYQDYRFAPVEMFVNRRPNVECDFADGRLCIVDPRTGYMIQADAAVRDNNNIGVFLRRAPGGNWIVIHAMQFECWPDEDCT